MHKAKLVYNCDAGEAHAFCQKRFLNVDNLSAFVHARADLLKMSYELPSHGHGAVLSALASMVALADRVVHCASPITGNVVSATRGLYLPCDYPDAGFFLYEVAEQGNAYHYVCGGSFNSPMGIYLSAQKTFLCYGNSEHYANHYVRTLETYLLRIPEISTRPREAATKTALVLGTVPNFGHYVWNELSGLERLQSYGLLRNVDVIALGPHFYSDAVLARLQGGNHKLVRFGGLPDMEEYFLERGLLPIRPVAFDIRKSPVIDVREACALLGSAVLDAIESAHLLKIWVGLPTGTKWRSWKNRSQLVRRVAAELQTLVGSSFMLLIDGFTRSTAEAFVDYRYVRAREADEAELCEACSLPGDAVLSMHGLSLEQKVALAQKCTVHVSLMGSTLTVPVWLAGLPGIAFGPKDLCAYSWLYEPGFSSGVAARTELVPSDLVVEDENGFSVSEGWVASRLRGLVESSREQLR